MFYALLPAFTVSSAGKFLPMSSDGHKMALFRCICFVFEGVVVNFSIKLEENELLSVFRN